MPDAGIIAKLRESLAASERDLASCEVKLEQAELGRHRAKTEYLDACKSIAKMHEAAVGEVREPIVGVVEDIKALREMALLSIELMGDMEETP